MTSYGPLNRPPAVSDETQSLRGSRRIGVSNPREWILRSTSGQETILRLEPGQSVTVGRDLSSDVPILDAGVSRHHATIALERDAEGKEALWVEDLHSHNGTFVNTERVQRAELHVGDVITFGRVRLTLLERQSGEELDPLAKLSQEQLALLLRVAREFAGETQQTLVFQRLLELAVEALKADRGALFLWDEERRTFHAVAAHPRSLFESASRLLDPSLGESILWAGTARLLPREEIPRCVASPRDPRVAALTDSANRLRGAPDASSRPDGSSGGSVALAGPVFSGRRPIGVLYLDRQGREGHSQADAHFLQALGWTTSTALGTSSQVSDMRAWNQRLESMIAERRSREPAGRAVQAADATILDPSVRATLQLLGELDEFLEAATKAASECDPETLERLSARAFQCARLRLRCIRRLAERASARLEEVQLAHAFQEASAPLSPYASCVPECGGELCVSCAPDELLLALELALDVLCSDPELEEVESGAPRPRSGDGECAKAELFWSATASSESSAISLRVSRRGEKEPTKAASAVRERLAELCAVSRRLGIELLQRIATERLKGEATFERQEDGALIALSLRLPNAWISLAETAFLSPQRMLASRLGGSPSEDAPEA